MHPWTHHHRDVDPHKQPDGLRILPGRQTPSTEQMAETVWKKESTGHQGWRWVHGGFQVDGRSKRYLLSLAALGIAINLGLTLFAAV